MKTLLMISLLAAIILYFIILFNLLKNKKLNLKYTLLWFLLGAVMIVLVLFPKILDSFKFIGIVEPINGLFAVLIFCLLMILMSITSIVSKLNEKNKTLIQEFAMLEKRIRELEKYNENIYPPGGKQ